MAATSIFCTPAPREDLRARRAPASSPSPAATASHASVAAIAPRSAPRLIASPSRPAAIDHDAALLAILDSPIRGTETALLGYQRKELELRAAMSDLPVLVARTLHARLLAARSDDALAVAFARLTVERRVRLISFLADARRREALAAAHR